MAIFANFVGTDGQSLPSQGEWEYVRGSGTNLFIFGNTAQSEAVAAELCVRRTEASFPADQYAEVTFSTVTVPLGGNSCMGPAVRCGAPYGGVLLTESGDRLTTESGEGLGFGPEPTPTGALLTEDGFRLTTEDGDALALGSYQADGLVLTEDGNLLVTEDGNPLALGEGGPENQGDYYGIYSDPLGCYLFKMIGGVWTQLATGVPWVDGDVIRLTVTGTSLVSTRNGSPTGMPSATDSALTSGRPGIAAYSDMAGGVPAALVSFGSTDAAALTVALTGQGMTLAAGAVVRTVAATLTGQPLAATAGSIALTSRTIGLTGELAGLLPGTVTRSAPLTVALTGQGMGLTGGSVALSLARTLAGASLALTGGIVSVGGAIVGQPMFSTPGQLTAGVTIALTGQGISIAVGAIGTATAVGIAGQGASLVASGNVGAAAAVPVLGQTFAASPGAMVAARDRALTGSAAALAAGLVSPSTGENVVVNLTGLSLTLTRGALGLSLLRALTGAAASVTGGGVVRSVELGLSGVAVGTLTPANLGGKGLAAPLTGTLLTVTPGQPTASGTLPALTGQGLALALGSVTYSRAVQLAGQRITATLGAVSFTEDEAAALTGQRMTFSPGIIRVNVYVAPPELPVRTLEGLPASWNTRTQVLAGVGALVAGSGLGCALGRFAWADELGRCVNTRQGATDRLGFVLMQAGPWSRVFYHQGRWWSRPGYPVTLVTRGDFWARFEGGAQAGQRVYARLLDGAALSGYAPGAELTPYHVARSCEPGGLTIISTWSTFTQ